MLRRAFTPLLVLTQFTDTKGAVAHAHGGGVVKVGAYYLWFGENRNADNTFKAVSAYRSTDLKTWEFRRNVLTRTSDPELAVANIERPKAIHNDDGTAYQVTSASGNADPHSYKLTADYTGYDSLAATPWPGTYREAPALFRRDGLL